MTLEEALYSHMTNQAGITALVGARIYPILMAQTAILPAIVYTRISTVREYSLSGFTGMTTARIQIDIMAQYASTAKTIADSVRFSLDGFVGLMGDVRIAQIMTDDEQAFYDNQTEYKRIMLDFLVTYYED